LDRLHKAWMILVPAVCFLVAFGGVRGIAQEEQDNLVGLVNMKECEGVTVTQCEVAKSLMHTLQMGEDLTCDACFNHLQALGIAPDGDWSYADPHKVISQKEMKEVMLEVQLAYNDGTVRFDGFEAAAGINDFCRDMKGSAPPEGVEQEGGNQTTPAQEPGMEPGMGKETGE
jgi:hypothetical protein